MEIKTTAYPKVNIGLYVGEKRCDGFHPIVSIFQLVKDPIFHDELTISISDSDRQSVSVAGLEEIASEKDNTIKKAAMLYLEQTGINADISVMISKGIPSQAGLGGGSSDAASVFLVLNKVFKRFDLEQLAALSSIVGSDVPFFVYECEAAVVKGRGEIVSPIKARTDISIKLIPNENSKMSTAQAYALLDKRNVIEELPDGNQLVEMYNRPISEWMFRNDFASLYDYHDFYLTGSGTCRFQVMEVDKG